MKIYQLNKKVKDLRITSAHLDKLEQINTLKLKGSRYEYLQTGIVIFTEVKLAGLIVKVAPLQAADGVISDNRTICYSTGGRDKFGVDYEHPIDVEENSAKEILLGFDLRGLDIGRYTSKLIFKDKYGSFEMDVIVDVNNDEVKDDLDNFDYRLEWLDSTMGIDDSIPAPYTPLKIEERTIELLGKKVLVGTNGLIQQVVGYWDDSLSVKDTPQSALFTAPMEFSVAREEFKETDFSLTGTESVAQIVSVSENARLLMETTAALDYSGLIKYNVKLTAKENIPMPSVSLKLYFDPACAKYSMGLGKLGGKFSDISFKWDSANNQDTLFCGSHKLGCAVKFVANDECEPYGSRVFDIPKQSWDNYGKGYIKVMAEDGAHTVTASSGLLVLTRGESVDFAFDLMLTPFKPYDMVKGYEERYAYVNINKSMETAIAGARRYNAPNLILDSGNYIYQAANNPILSAQAIKRFLKEAEYYGAKVALCYDLNYLSSTNSLFKPLSMLDMLVNTESSVGEVEGLDVRPVMAGCDSVRVGDNKTAKDLIFAVDPKSRFCNFYVQSVAELLKKLNLHGIFLSNTVMDGFTAKRLKKALAAKEGTLGLYISDQRKAEHGNASGFNKHMQLLPYIDKIILGADFALSREPDYYLTELSGLLFGLTTTIVGLTNPYLGMLHGMSAQAGIGEGDPSIIYDIWNKFGLEGSRIMGYWMDNPPIIADNAEVKITTYAKKDSCLAVFYNFSEKPLNVVFGINPEILGFSTLNKQIRIVTTKGKKAYRRVKNPDEGIKIGAKQGLIIKIF
jgi:hypothetical protein